MRGDRAVSFLRSMLSERDGTVSNTRVCIAVVITFSLGWVTALLIRLRGPLSATDVATVIAPLGMFVGGVTSALYAINKGADVLNNRAEAEEKADIPPQL